MKKNMGKTDKIVRLLIAVVLLIVFANDFVIGVWGILSLLLAGILVLTSLVSFCPLYRLFHLHTNKRKDHVNMI